MKKRFTATALASLLALAGAACSDEPNRDDAGAITEEGDLDAWSIAVGDCLLEPQMVDGEFSDIAAVPCGEAHDYEAIHVFDIADEVVFPGEEKTSELAGEGCLAEFDAAIGAAYADSTLDFTIFTPTLESWAQGDREVVCVAYAMSGEQLTGSVAGSGL